MRDELDQISEDIEYEIDSADRHSRKLDRIISNAYLLRTKTREREKKLEHAVDILRDMR